MVMDKSSNVQEGCDLRRREIVFQEVAQRLGIEHLDVGESGNHVVVVAVVTVAVRRVGQPVDRLWAEGGQILGRGPRAVFGEEEAVVLVVGVLVVVLDRLTRALQQVLSVLNTASCAVRDEGRVVDADTGLLSWFLRLMRVGHS